MATLAKELPVIFIPEQFLVVPVRNNMVYCRSGCELALVSCTSRTVDDSVKTGRGRCAIDCRTLCWQRSPAQTECNTLRNIRRPTGSGRQDTGRDLSVLTVSHPARPCAVRRNASRLRRRTEQPLWFFLTAVGIGHNSIGWAAHQKALDILKGRKADPCFCLVIFGLPDDADWTSGENWNKASLALLFSALSLIING